jgi:hypothetical protein
LRAKRGNPAASQLIFTLDCFDSLAMTAGVRNVTFDFTKVGVSLQSGITLPGYPVYKAKQSAATVTVYDDLEKFCHSRESGNLRVTKDQDSRFRGNDRGLF